MYMYGCVRVCVYSCVYKYLSPHSLYLLFLFFLLSPRLLPPTPKRHHTPKFNLETLNFPLMTRAQPVALSSLWASGYKLQPSL